MPVAFTTTRVVISPAGGAHDEVGTAVVHGRDRDRPPHVEPEEALVVAVVLGDDVARRPAAVRGLEGDARTTHARQVMDAMRRPEPQRLPPVLPGATGAGAAVEHDLVDAAADAEALQVVRDGETGLTCADHDHVDAGG